MLYRPQPENAPYGIANRNTKLRGHASVAWLFGAAQDSKLQRTPPRSPLVDEIHRHAESLIDFGSTDKRSRAPHTTQISLVDEFLDRLPDSPAANAELFTEFLVRMEPFAVFLPTQNRWEARRVGKRCVETWQSGGA